MTTRYFSKLTRFNYTPGFYLMYSDRDISNLAFGLDKLFSTSESALDYINRYSGPLKVECFEIIPESKLWCTQDLVSISKLERMFTPGSKDYLRVNLPIIPKLAYSRLI